MKLPAPNRIAVYLTAAGGLLAALAPAVANLDLSSTVGIVGGLLAVAGVVRKWLEGWQAHEARQATANRPVAKNSNPVGNPTVGEVVPDGPPTPSTAARTRRRTKPQS